ncbi:MAG: FecR domain-containing protein [Bacteroidota bacterium]
MSKHYIFFTVHDFALDDYFIQWVQSPNAESNAFWYKWIKDHPDKKAIIDEARQLVLAMDFSSSRPSQKEFFEVKAKIDQVIKSSDQKSDGIQLLSWQWASVAAVIALLTISWFVFQSPMENAQVITHATAFGETRLITLPDNSTVLLNANSTIKYTDDWDEKLTREVWLEGEGFFDVKKVIHSENEGSVVRKQFLVHSGAMQVEVLGTTFNVNSREETSKVVLASGKIALTVANDKDTTKLAMNPGDFIQYTSTTREILKKEVDAKKFTSWRENKLHFEETSLEEVASIIENNYGLKVVFEHPDLKQITLTGTMSTASLETFIDVLSESIDAQIENQDGQLIIKN